MSDLDQQIRAILNGYDHDAAGQIDDLTGALRAVLDQCKGVEGPLRRNTLPIDVIRDIIAAELGITERTSS